jgi:hypothetical protein
MANNKEPYVLMTLYQNLYAEKYKKPATLNKFREKWAMQDVIDSVGLDKAIELMNYYFSLEKFGHPLQFFYYNFDKMENARNELQKDIEARRLLREHTKKMVEEGGL